MGRCCAATRIPKAIPRNGKPLVNRPRGPHPLPLFLATVARVADGDRDRLGTVLAGVRRYQDAPVAAPRPQAPVMARIGSTLLRDHGGGRGQPVVVVPSLINPPTVLDLSPGKSLLGYLARAGLRPLLVDWGDPDAAALGLDLAGHVEHRLVPLIASTVGALGRPVALAGYCLGGTMALAAATLRPDLLTRLALLAAPWRFAGYAADRRAAMSDYWAQVSPLAAPLGCLPMDMLQPAFWTLDEAALATKFARVAGLDGAALADFVALEDWANAGAPLPLPAARELAIDFFGADLPGSGRWRVGDAAIDPRALPMPVLDLVAARDRIVPPAAAAGIGDVRRLDAGHVGMVVGGRARALLWEPLAAWLATG